MKFNLYFFYFMLIQSIHCKHNIIHSMYACRHCRYNGMKYNRLNGTNVNTVDTDYSCELNDSKSESDEVHTLELPLLMFITLSTTWCNLEEGG